MVQVAWLSDTKGSMAYYFRPVSGNVSLQKLECFAVNRLQFLLQINRISGDRLRMLDLVNTLSTVVDSDCLIEGTQKDNISHFILRLLLVADEQTAEFIVRAETQLFQFRFSCLTEDEIYKLLKSSQKHVITSDRPTPETYNYNNVQHILSTFLSLKESAQSWKNVAHKYMQERTAEWFEVPFQAVVSLVAKRQVKLRSGWAYVAYDDLEEVLTRMFESVLRLTLQQTREIRDIALQDVRMKRLASRLKSIYRGDIPVLLDLNNLTCLSHDQVDQLESLFPLCMSNLHQALRTEHRLKHNDRIQYSLFLKEAGMPVHQAIKFWKQEYSQSSSLPGTCQHSWQKDERRYVYSIRHLYGLEGARRNYRGHCCASLQRRQLGPSEQGGCPFVHFDYHHLSELLTSSQIAKEDLTAIMNFKSVGPPCETCKMYLKSKMELHLSQHCGDTVNVMDTVRKHGQDEVADCQPECQKTEPARNESDCVCNGNNTDDSSDVKCDSSDEDVIFVSIKSRPGSVKRRSLSTNSGVKKQILWYETERLEKDQKTKDDLAIHGVIGKNGLNRQTTLESNSCQEKGNVVINVKPDHDTEKTECLMLSMRRAESISCSNMEKMSLESTECDSDVVHTVEMANRDCDTCKHHLMHSVHVPNGNSSEYHAETVDMWSKGQNSVRNTSSISMNGQSVSIMTHTSRSNNDVDMTKDEINNGVSCFEHDICPSQVISYPLTECTHNMQSLPVLLKDLQIYKPINFYTSFKKMLDGLKSNNKKK